MLQDGSTNYVTGPGGLPLEQVTGTTVTYYHYDQLGSVRGITDASGNLVAAYTYDPYGNLITSTGSLNNPFLYAGQYKDLDTGLYYLRARYYDPSTAEFLSTDPMSFTTRQRYGYVSGNPLNRTDPRGLCWPDWACHAASAVGGGFSNLGSAVHNYDVAHASDLVQFASVASTISMYSGLIGRGCALAGLMTGVADPVAWVPDLCAAVFTGISLGTGLLAVGADLAACNGGSIAGCRNAPWAAGGLVLQLVGAGVAGPVGAEFGPVIRWACGATFALGGAALRNVHSGTAGASPVPGG